MPETTSTGGFWNSISGALGKVVTVVADKAANSFTKADELSAELAYYKATGQAVPASGYVSATGISSSTAAAPVAATGKMSVGLMVGIGAGVLLVVILLVTGGRRR